MLSISNACTIDLNSAARATIALELGFADSSGKHELLCQSSLYTIEDYETSCIS